MSAPATAKQLTFLKTLFAERQQSEEAVAIRNTMLSLYHQGELTREGTSKMIDHVKEIPRDNHTGTIAEPVHLEDGFYELYGAVYKVQHAVHGSGQQYAKQLNDNGEFEYAGRKPLHSLLPENQLTLERAKELGKLYGRCMVCGRTLTDETSIANGIGPVCQGRFES